MPVDHLVPPSTGLRKIAGLLAVVVGSFATIATSPPEQASLGSDVTDVVVVPAAPDRIVKGIDVELSPQSVTPELGTLRIQVWASTGGAPNEDASIRVLVGTPPPGIEAETLHEELLVGDGEAILVSSHHGLEHCQVGPACVTTVPLVLERVDDGEGSVTVDLQVQAAVEWDQLEPGTGPEGSEITLTVTDTEQGDLSNHVVLSPVERIVLDPALPSTQRTMQITLPDEIVDGLDTGYGLLVAKLSPETREEGPSGTVIGSFRIDEGDSLGRQLHPAGGVEAFEVLGSCEPIDGACEITKVIDFRGCGRCEKPVELDWWVTLRLQHHQPPPAEVTVGFAASGLIETRAEQTTSFADTSTETYSLTAVVDSEETPDSVRLVVSVSHALGGQGSFGASAVLLRHRASGAEYTALPHSPAEVSLLGDCDVWTACEVEFDIEVTGGLGIDSLGWVSRLQASFADSDDIVEGAAVDIVLEPKS